MRTLESRFSILLSNQTSIWKTRRFIQATIILIGLGIPFLLFSSESFPHIVQEGESLWGIARAYQISYQDLLRHNSGINPERITVGQRIQIPGNRSTNRRSSSVVFERPVHGNVVTSYGEREYLFHTGIIYAVAHGQQVYAARTGEVVFVSSVRGYGTTIMLKHPEQVYSVYSSKNLHITCRIGQQLAKGTALGTTTSHATRLLFQIFENGVPKNPLDYL